MKHHHAEGEIHVRIRVTGKVQGVYFRASARERAAELGVSGTVENKDDGSVLLEMRGTPKAIDQLVAWCHQGPPLARVDRVTVSEAPPGLAGCDSGPSKR